jgi:CHAT domain-containing protein
VKSLLVSLWEVPDLATKELMVLFYKELIINDYDQEKAFKIAQKNMCDKYRSDISKWAGFVLIR